MRILFLFLLISFGANANTVYHCQNEFPPFIATTIGFSSLERGFIEIDSDYLYPDTGISWRLLLERFHRENEENLSYANFQTFDQYIYNFFVPKTVLAGIKLESFPSEIHWQIEEDSTVYSSDLKCELKH